MTMGKPKRIQTLESLRFILALLVMQSHLRIADWSFKYFYNGNLAVIYFFMLSGFGMTYESLYDSQQCMENSRWSLVKEFKNAFGRMKKIYFWYMLFIIISLPWQFYDLLTWHNVTYAIIGTLATILITPTMLQSILGFYQSSHLGLGAYWFVSTLFILRLVYPLLHRIKTRFLYYKSVCIMYISIVVVFCVSMLVWDGLHFISKNSIFNDLDYGSPLTCVFYFVIGMLYCDLYMLCKKTNKDLTILEIMVLFAFIAWCLGRNSFMNLSDLWKHVVDVFICMTLLGMFMFNGGGVSGKFLQSKLLLKLNKYSMYIYLGHYVLATHIRCFLGITTNLGEVEINIVNKILVILLLVPLCLYMRKYDLRNTMRVKND